MNGERASSGLRIHQELLRAHLETGFNLAHFVETASVNDQSADIRRALSEARHALSESKRLLSSMHAPAVDDFWPEIRLLEFELSDLELHMIES